MTFAPADVLRAQAPPGPSPPAPLSGTQNWSEGPIALSADGTVAARYEGPLVTWTTGSISPWPAWLDLRQECGADLVSVAGPQSEGGGGPAPAVPLRVDARPSLSADGSRMAFWHRVQFGGSGAMEFRLRLAGRATVLGIVHNSLTSQPDQRLPRPHIAPTGRALWAKHQPQTAPVPSGVLLDLGPGLDDPASPPCDVPFFSPGIAQPAFSADGTMLVGQYDDLNTVTPGASLREIQRLTRDASGWCGGPRTSLRLARLNPSPSSDLADIFEIYDTTISADGRVVAWTSDTDHCATGDPLPNTPTRDLWLWYDAGLDPPSFAAQICPAVEGGGRLARIDLDALATEPTEETFAVLASDASFVEVVSSGRLVFGGNPAGRACLFELPLPPIGVPTGVFQLSADPGAMESVVGVAVSANRSIVTYTLDRSAADEFLGDNFLVRRDRGADPALPDDPLAPIAAEPFDLELTSCMAGAGTATMDLRLRQWRGGSRALILVGEVEDEFDPLATSRFSPVVQAIGDEQVVNFSVSVPFTGTSPICHARALNGSSAHPEIVAAWRQP